MKLKNTIPGVFQTASVRSEFAPRSEDRILACSIFDAARPAAPRMPLCGGLQTPA
jgi:hypothetical protein